MHNHPSDSNLSRLQEILHLPPLPGVAYQLIKEITNDDVDITHLTRLIEQDPGLAARIVGIANSAYFARQREINSVEDAIVRVLGLNIVRGLAIGIALSKPFDVSACPEFQFERYWYRAFVTANLADRLGPFLMLEPDDRQCLFLAGLLHNLGQLVLVHAFPGRMIEVFRRHAEDPTQSLLTLETQSLAVDEIGAGSLIAKRWKLPRCVQHVIQYRHKISAAGKFHPLVKCIAQAIDVAEQLYNNPAEAHWTLDQFGDYKQRLTQEHLDMILDKARDNDESNRQLAASLAVLHD